MDIVDRVAHVCIFGAFVSTVLFIPVATKLSRALRERDPAAYAQAKENIPPGRPLLQTSIAGYYVRRGLFRKSSDPEIRRLGIWGMALQFVALTSVMILAGFMLWNKHLRS